MDSISIVKINHILLGVMDSDDDVGMQKSILPVAPIEESFDPSRAPESGEEYLRLVRYELGIIPKVVVVDKPEKAFCMATSATLNENMGTSSISQELKEYYLEYYEEMRMKSSAFLDGRDDSKVEYSFPHENDSNAWFFLLFSCLPIAQNDEELKDKEQTEGETKEGEHKEEEDEENCVDFIEALEFDEAVEIIGQDEMDFNLDEKGEIEENDEEREEIEKDEEEQEEGEEGEIIVEMPSLSHYKFASHLSHKQIICLLKHIRKWLNSKYLKVEQISDLCFTLLVLLDKKLLSCEISILRDLCKLFHIEQAEEPYKTYLNMFAVIVKYIYGQFDISAA